MQTPTGLRMVNMPCKSRNCTLCIENIVGDKMELLLGDDLYVWSGSNQDWQAELRRLQRLRKQGEYAPAMRIPTGPDTIMVVSPYEIGPSIDHLSVEWALREAEPSWGNISVSGEWRVPKEHADPPAEDTCYGVMTESLERFEETAELLGVPTREDARGLYWVCDDRTRRLLVAAAGCVSLADFWAKVKLGWDDDFWIIEHEPGDWFVGAAV